MSNKLKKTASIVVMPDFSIDRIIKLKTKEELFNVLNEKSKRSNFSASTVDVKGGNAVNVAYCLAILGMKVTLFTIADEIGSAILRQIFLKFEDRISLHIVNGRHGLTTSIEYPNERGYQINVMFADLGDNRNIGPEKFDFRKYSKIIADADLVAVVNWATNQSGTPLMKDAFEKSPNSLHFVDPADISTRKEEFHKSLKDIGKEIHILSINENEYNSIARSFGLEFLIPEESYGEHNVKDAVQAIAERIEAKNVDLHTKIGAAWSNGKECIFVPSFKCEIRQTTGAGDSWNSANILGYISELEVEERLRLSNAYASLYISSPNLEPAKMDELLHFLDRERIHSNFR